MYNLIKEIRGQELEGLAEMLKKRILSFDENFDGMMIFAYIIRTSALFTFYLQGLLTI
jgi:hypothetical protein